MRIVDFAPLARSTVGFDRMVSLLQQGLLQQGPRQTDGYPPYNIEKTGETAYRITLSVAGFAPEGLNLITREGELVVTGKQAEEASDPPEEKAARYLHRGLPLESFERRFDLADSIKVIGARLENGLLSIDLAREIPEARKPRTVPIAISAPSLNAAA